MRIAFTAPLKSPLHPTPSGDRAIARLFLSALQRAGHDVRLVGRWRSFDAQGNAGWQGRWAELGPRLALRQQRHWQAEQPRWQPDLIFCYHLYQKAVDWIGPVLADLYDVPYIAAEASHAPKQADGPWAMAHGALSSILRHRANGIITLNPVDRPCILKATSPDCLHLDLPLFADLEQLTRARSLSPALVTRAGLGISEATPLLITIAMMRHRAKLPSYQLLAKALHQVSQSGQTNWHLVIGGDGPARSEVEQAFAPLGDQITFIGAVPPAHIPATLAEADLFCWPAINEAMGMTFIEAQAMGLPVIAGLSPGVSSVLDPSSHDGAKAEDLAGYTDALTRILAKPRDELERLGQSAAAQMRDRHDLSPASATIDAFLSDVRAKANSA